MFYQMFLVVFLVFSQSSLAEMTSNRYGELFVIDSSNGNAHKIQNQATIGLTAVTDCILTTRYGLLYTVNPKNGEIARIEEASTSGLTPSTSCFLKNRHGALFIVNPTNGNVSRIESGLLPVEVK